MGLTWNGDEAYRRAQRAAAAALLRAAIYLVSEHMQALAVSSPHQSRRRTRNTRAGSKGSSYLTYTDPSKPGEYPKLRTGAGQKSTWYEPRSVDEVVAGGMTVRVGHKRTTDHEVGNHLIALTHKGRKGLKDTLATARPALVRLIAGGAA